MNKYTQANILTAVLAAIMLMSAHAAQAVGKAHAPSTGSLATTFTLTGGR